jgi:hypothetical protein
MLCLLIIFLQVVSALSISVENLLVEQAERGSGKYVYGAFHKDKMSRNNPTRDHASESPFTEDECASYCGPLIYKRGSYKLNDTFYHLVSNRKFGNSMQCFCHFPEYTDDAWFFKYGYREYEEDFIKKHTEYDYYMFKTTVTSFSDDAYVNSEYVNGQTSYPHTIGNYSSPALYNIVDGIIPDGLSQYKGCSRQLQISKDKPEHFVNITCSDIRYSIFDHHKAHLQDDHVTIERKYTEMRANSSHGICELQVATPSGILNKTLDITERLIEEMNRYGHCDGTMGEIVLTEDVYEASSCDGTAKHVRSLAECNYYLGGVEEVYDDSKPYGCVDGVFNANEESTSTGGDLLCYNMKYTTQEQASTACSIECESSDGYSLQWDTTDIRQAGRVQKNRRFECRCGTPMSEQDCVLSSKEWVSNIFLTQFQHSTKVQSVARVFAYENRYLYCPLGECKNGYVNEKCKYGNSVCDVGSWYNNNCNAPADVPFCKNDFVEEPCKCGSVDCQPGFYCTKAGECKQMVSKDKKVLQARYKYLSQQ